MADEQIKIEAIKSFDANLRCRDFQFEIGKTYTQDGEIVICENGFHAIEGHPLEVFNYYAPAFSRFAIVECSGNIARNEGDDSKIASASITIKAELRLHELIQRAVKWVFARAKPENSSSATGGQGAASATGYQGAASATGDQGAASATGHQGAASATGYEGAASATGGQGAASATDDQGAASATGYQGAASATGNQGAASATGYQGAASATGHQGAASATGYQGAASATGHQGAASATAGRSAASATGDASVAMSCGYEGRVSGADGCALFLVNRDSNTGGIRHVWAGIVGRNGVKANTFYTLDRDGATQEVTPW